MEYCIQSDKHVLLAIKALENGDRNFFSFFTAHPTATYYGGTINFEIFFTIALENNWFLTIDEVKNSGKDVYGNFKAGHLGAFTLCFKFRQNEDGKFCHLEIGPEEEYSE